MERKVCVCGRTLWEKALRQKLPEVYEGSLVKGTLPLKGVFHSKQKLCVLRSCAQCYPLFSFQTITANIGIFVDSITDLDSHKKTHTHSGRETVTLLFSRLLKNPANRSNQNWNFSRKGGIVVQKVCREKVSDSFFRELNVEACELFKGGDIVLWMVS